MKMVWNDMMRTMAALSLCTACGVKSVGDLEGGDDGSEDAGSSGDDGDDPTDSDPSNGTTPSETGTGDDGDEPTDSDPSDPSSEGGSDESGGECPPQASVCDPQPVLEPEATAWSIDQNAGFQTALVDIRCVVADFVDDDTTMTIELHCDEEELASHILVLPHNPITPLNIGVDSSVQLTYHAQTPFWTDYWFTLRQLDGRLIIGAGDGHQLLPFDDLFAPLTLAVLDDVCPQECRIDECGATERHAVEVGLDGETTRIYDANSAVVGSTTQYTVMIGEATGYVGDIDCTDIPPTWYRTIVYDSSEG